jgi:hypothetical protein
MKINCRRLYFRKEFPQHRRKPVLSLYINIGKKKSLKNGEET